jgi:hypothetical protein
LRYFTSNTASNRPVKCPLPIQKEIDLNRRGHRNGLAVFHTWPEFPLFEAFYGLLIQAMTQSAVHADVVGTTIGSDLGIENNSSLDAGGTGLVAVLGINLVGHDGRGCIKVRRLPLRKGEGREYESQRSNAHNAS